MIDFEVQRFTRRCRKTNREFQPGDVYYSALVASGADVQRWDYAADAWDAPPEGTIGWWKSRVPDAQSQTTHWAPSDVVLHYFEQLEKQPEKIDVRYVLALWMVRRRVVRLEEIEKDDAGCEQLVLYCPRNEQEYRAAVATPDEPRIAAIQQELAELLFADATA